MNLIFLKHSCSKMIAFFYEKIDPKDTHAKNEKR